MVAFFLSPFLLFVSPSSVSLHLSHPSLLREKGIVHLFTHSLIHSFIHSFIPSAVLGGADPEVKKTGKVPALKEGVV